MENHKKMKKIFAFLALSMLIVGVSADTPVDFDTSFYYVSNTSVSPSSRVYGGLAHISGTLTYSTTDYFLRGLLEIKRCTGDSAKWEDLVSDYMDDGYLRLPSGIMTYTNTTTADPSGSNDLNSYWAAGGGECALTDLRLTNSSLMNFDENYARIEVFQLVGSSSRGCFANINATDPVQLRLIFSLDSLPYYSNNTANGYSVNAGGAGLTTRWIDTQHNYNAAECVAATTTTTTTTSTTVTTTTLTGNYSAGTCNQYIDVGYPHTVGGGAAPGVTVRVYDISNTAYTAITNVNGTAFFNGIPVGNYRVDAELFPQYPTKTYIPNVYMSNYGGGLSIELDANRLYNITVHTELNGNQFDYTKMAFDVWTCSNPSDYDIPLSSIQDGTCEKAIDSQILHNTTGYAVRYNVPLYNTVILTAKSWETGQYAVRVIDLTDLVFSENLSFEPSDELRSLEFCVEDFYSGAPLTGSNLSIKSAGVDYLTKTNANMCESINGLPNIPYYVTVRKSGYSGVTQEEHRFFDGLYDYDEDTEFILLKPSNLSSINQSFGYYITGTITDCVSGDEIDNVKITTPCLPGNIYSDDGDYKIGAIFSGTEGIECNVKMTQTGYITDSTNIYIFENRSINVCLRPINSEDDVLTRLINVYVKEDSRNGVDGEYTPVQNVKTVVYCRNNNADSWTDYTDVNGYVEFSHIRSDCQLNYKLIKKGYETKEGSLNSRDVYDFILVSEVDKACQVTGNILYNNGSTQSIRLSSVNVLALDGDKLVDKVLSDANGGFLFNVVCGRTYTLTADYNGLKQEIKVSTETVEGSVSANNDITFNSNLVDNMKKADELRDWVLMMFPMFQMIILLFVFVVFTMLVYKLTGQ